MPAATSLKNNPYSRGELRNRSTAVKQVPRVLRSPQQVQLQSEVEASNSINHLITNSRRMCTT